MTVNRKASDIGDVAEKARKRPFRSYDTIYRHSVTVFVDTAEVNEDRVADAVQQAVDEVTNTIQGAEDVTFDAAAVVEARRIHRQSPTRKR